MASNIEGFLYEIKPQVLGWINQAIASASLNGITLTLPPNVAYLNVRQTFTEEQTISTTSTDVNATHAALSAIQYANPSGADTLGFAIGSWNFGILASGNANNFNNVVGSLSYGQHYGSGTVSNVAGIGALATLENAGQITLARAVNARVDNNGAGTIAAAAGIYVEGFINGGGGTITKAAGVWTNEQSVGTNNTNLHIGSTLQTGNWSIYNASTRDNYFGGGLLMGTTAHIAAGVFGALSTTQTIFINDESTDGSNGGGAIYANGNINPSANTSQNYIGVFGVQAISSGNIRNFTGSIRGVNGLGIHGGTGTASFVYGVSANIRNDSSGTITSARSMQAALSNLSTGTVSAGYGLFVETFVNSGGGTFTGAAGIAMADMAVGTNKTNVLLGTTTIPSGTWNIYASSTANNYFNGNIGINTTTFPTSLAKGIAIVNGTAASASLTDGVGLWAADFAAGDSRLYARYESMSAGAPIAVLGLAQTWTAIQTWDVANTYKQVSTPSNPASGYNKIYPKSDDHWYILTSGGTEVQLAEGATTGDVVRVDEQTASASAQIDIALSSSYRYFIIFFKTVKNATATVTFQMLFSNDGGSTYLSTNYDYHFAHPDASSTSYAGLASTSAAAIVFTGNMDTTSGRNLSGWVVIENPFATDEHVISASIRAHEADNTKRTITGQGGNSSTTALTNVRFKFSSGNISTGTFTTYGFK